jgi:PIN domain nuclease of toxin-antitoxin system
VEALIYLDTNVVIWLQGLATQHLSKRAIDLLDQEMDLRISPMVRLELQYLYEIQRIGAPAASVVDELGARLGVTVCRAAFPAVVASAESFAWTRDPFDRIIVAQALLHDAPLLTADQLIHKHYAGAVW